MLPRQHVLLTRPQPDSVRIAGMVETRGFVPVVAPLLEIHARPAALPKDVQAVLVTSGNAFMGVSAWPVPVFAVGDATAAQALACGFTEVASAARDAAALTTLVARTLRPAAGALLLLSGAGQGHALAASLRDAGFSVHRSVTYSAAPVRHFPQSAAAALARDTLHAAIFLSAETAAAFVRLLPVSSVQHLHGVLGLAIGKAAAETLDALPWRQVRCAAAPDLDNVLALL
jgi:uroporphyrinogen-III synthase